MKLRFHTCVDGSVECLHSTDCFFQGYENCVHGGIIATMLDAGMVHCLFNLDIEAVTADMNIRYKKPVLTGQQLLIKAWLVEKTPPLFILKSKIIQNNEICAVAKGKFVLFNRMAVDK
jgi:acyl-coenzyme A thioesterase PaaI-like protein